MMQRRDFLRGVLLSASAGTALIQLASPAETAALVPSQPVVLGHPEPEFFYPSDSPEVYVRRPNGGFVCVGLVTRLDVRQEIHREHSWTGEAILIPGLKEGQLFFEGRPV